MAYGNSPRLNLKVLTTNRDKFIEGQFAHVSLPILGESPMEVLPYHCPVTGLLGPGAIRSYVSRPQGVVCISRLELSTGGFVEVAKNQIRVLVSRKANFIQLRNAHLGMYKEKIEISIRRINS